MRSALLFCLLAGATVQADAQCLRQCAEMIKALDAECRKHADAEERQSCLAMKASLERECATDCKKQK
ncbi:MAG: hypothetical protein JNJ54_02765 [Myxococcaceae bacterium]|nr:hypothetical protein [Myxococcaceae bacterium]